MDTALLCLLVLAAAGSPAAPNPSADAVLHARLKPGATGAMCLDCHERFAAKLQKPVVHTPVKSGDCVGCHNPHASQHGNLLSAEGNKVCLTCHAKLLPQAAKSVHQPVAEGACTRCHDPHSSDEKFVLVKPAGELCASCHQSLVTAIAAAKVPHKVLKDGCSTCHDPHASGVSARLLKAAQPELCARCHKLTDPAFSKLHQDFPVAKAGCTTCHDPHGSNTRGMLRDTVHKPVAEKECGSCHEAPRPGQPVRLKAEGAELCKTCHEKQIAAMLSRTKVHWPVIQRGGCLSCHTAHASSAPKLLNAELGAVCERCHPSTVARSVLSPTKHPPVAKAECSKCHEPHGGDAPLYLKGANTVELCGTCHDWQKHSSHPIGEKLKDPRNQNATLDCLSCHRAHGTEYKHLMPFASVSELCTKCHEQYKR